MWLVGHWIGVTTSGLAIWQYVTLEQSQAAADRACIDPDHFVLPVRVGTRVPEDTSVWDAVVYPRRPPS
jgi:hypothetical protein